MTIGYVGGCRFDLVSVVMQVNTEFEGGERSITFSFVPTDADNALLQALSEKNDQLLLAAARADNKES